MELGEYLVLYYHNTFPFDAIYQFMRSTPLREYAITLQNSTFVRPLTFTSAEELKSLVLKKIPLKMDLGAIYDKKPETGSDMRATSKELVFDIDLTDYKRHCCEGKTTCNKCLILLKCAGRIMDYVLRKCFGYSKILYVFSGGRGMHIWVCDDGAIKLNSKERQGIVDCISTKNKVLYKSVRHILEDHLEYFDDVKMSDDEKFDELFVKIDKNVTSDIKHLLKAPFAVHQTTKKISVPMSIEMLDNLRIEDVPILEDVLDNTEMLEPYIAHFEKFVQQL